MMYKVEVWIFGKGYFVAFAIGKKQAVARQVEILSHFAWYDLQTYDTSITKLV